MSGLDPLVETTAEGDDQALEIHPFPGLRPFREEESHLFFGREGHRRELLKRLTTTRFVAVVGTSGSGKSSLIRAGLLPDLYSGYLPKAGSDWLIVDASPGNNPIGRLARAFGVIGWPIAEDELRTNSTQILETARARLQPGQHLLVLIDQFEELFRLAAREHPVADQDEKASLVRLLLQAGGQAGERALDLPVHVIIAMRSEFLGKASTYRGLPEAIDQGQYLIPRLSREQLRKAIESPVHVAHGEIDEPLIQKLLNELGDDQDQLPVLQHALMRTWDRWRQAASKPSIDDECYRLSGGFEDALSDDATEILGQTERALGDEGVRIVKRTFQSLRETDVNGGQARRPTSVRDLCEIAQCELATLRDALKPFRKRSFLLPPVDVELTPDTMVDVSHEALLRRWTTLKTWIEEDDLDRRLYLRIATRAAEEAGSPSPDYFAPPLLGVLQKFWDDRKPSPQWARRHHPGYDQARDFLVESGAHQQTLDKVAARRTKRKEQMWTAIALLAAALVLVAIWVYRSNQTQKVLESQTRQLESQVVAIKAASTSDSDLETRIQLAAEALKRDPALDTQRLLLSSLFTAARPMKEIRLAPVEYDFDRIVLSGKRDAVYLNGPSELRVLNVATGAQVWRMDAPSDGQVLLVPTADGGRAFVTGPRVRILDASSGRELASLNIPDADAYAAAYTGDLVAVSGPDAIWTCHTSTMCQDLTRHPTPRQTATDIELSKDGSLLLALDDRDDAGRLRVRLVATSPWKVVQERTLDTTESILAQSLDGDSFRLCTRTSLSLFDTYDETLDKRDDTAFPNEVSSCQFDGDHSLVTVHNDRTLRVWNKANDLMAVAPARGGEPKVSIAGGIAAVHEPQRIGLWTIDNYGHRPGSAPFAALPADGTHAISGTRVVDLASGRETAFAPPPGEVPISFRVVGSSGRTAMYQRRGNGSPPGALFFMETRDNRTVGERWRVPFPVGGTSDDERGYSSASLAQVSIGADDRFVSVGVSSRPGVAILDAANGRVLRRIEGGTQPILVPGRNEVLVREGERDDARFVAWPIPEGPSRPVATDGFRVGQVRAVAFSHDGRWLAAAEAAGDDEDASAKRTWNVRVWDWPGLVPRATLPHSAPITSLTFGGDGKTVLTATESTTTIHVWTIEPVQEIARVPYRPASGRARVPGMALTPARHLAFSDSTGVTVLPLDVQQWITESCSRISRNLTQAEWIVLFGMSVPHAVTCADRSGSPSNRSPTSGVE